MLDHRGNQVCNRKSFSANTREVLVIWVQFTKNVQRIQSSFDWASCKLSFPNLPKRRLSNMGTKQQPINQKKTWICDGIKCWRNKKYFSTIRLLLWRKIVWSKPVVINGRFKFVGKMVAKNLFLSLTGKHPKWSVTKVTVLIEVIGLPVT